MKDILVTSSQIKRELKWLLGILVISILFNIFSIIKYNTAWRELVTQLHIVLFLTLILYFLILLLRLLTGLILRIIRGGKT